MTRLKTLPTYARMLYVGLFAALVVADLMARRLGLSPTRVLAAALLLTPLLLAGARALAVALNWRHFRERPEEILRMDHGGAALYGALPPALLASVPLLSWLGLPLGAFWDIAGVAMLVGMIPTRFGCLAAGCCRGRIVRAPWGPIRLPNPMLEALLGAGLLALLFALRSSLPFSGAAFLIALGGYAVGRFGLEWAREERANPVLGLTAFQWISAVLVVGCATGLAAGLGSVNEVSFVTAGLQESSASGLSIGRVLFSAVALIPIMLLFRFLGCSLLLDDPPETPRFELRADVGVPDPDGSGPDSFSVEITLEDEADGSEPPESPLELPFDGILPGDRLSFLLLVEIDQGDYRASCRVTHATAPTRTGSCSGSLNAPDLILRFGAEETDPVTVINAQLCFEPSP